MKIDWKTVSGFLAKPDDGIAALLLYGPDAGLARERSQAVITKLLGPSPDPLSILELYESQLTDDPALLIDELSAISLLADKRVILIRQAGDKLTKVMELAAEYLRPDVYVIVLADDLASKSSLRAWFEKQKNTAALACYQDEARDVSQVIREAFTQAGKQVSSDVVQYLASQMGNDRYVTRQELGKIITYMGEDASLSLEDAMALTDYNRDTGTDDVVTHLADRHISALDTALQRLVADGMQPVQYLRSASRYFQRLYTIRIQAENSSIEAVIEGLRPPVFYKQKPHLIRHAKSWSTESLIRALHLISAAELACKTTDIPATAASSRKLMQVTQLRS